jgi:hypothetical protein
MTPHLKPVAFACALLFGIAAVAGGPKLVGGPAVGTRPAFGLDGKGFVWDPSKMPIAYRVDPGPMAENGGNAIVSNAAGVQRVQNMFAVWQAVPTAALSFVNAGPVLPAGSYSGGDVRTAQAYNDIIGSCNSGAQSPIVFDADRSLMADLGLSKTVIGFEHDCSQDATTGYITSAAVVLNGAFQDGVYTNGEMTADEFDEAITHEIGHFLGLDHSQINLDLLTGSQTTCDTDGLAGMPLMFPIATCRSRKSVDLPVLAPDDVAWISTLYPSASYASAYGTISGRIYFSDGMSPAQGVNVIARLVDDLNTPEDESRRVAVSVVSGYLFTANPGQSVTADMADPREDNRFGDRTGSHNPGLIGYYELHVPPGTYTVEVESVYEQFDGGSSVGPLSPPAPLPGLPEFWKQDESAFDIPLQRDTITVHGGDTIRDVDIILNSTKPRFDQYEDDGARMDAPVPYPLRREKAVRA